jgi:hypothetical protein
MSINNKWAKHLAKTAGILFLSTSILAVADEKNCATTLGSTFQKTYNPAIQSLENMNQARDHSNVSERVLPILKTVSGAPSKSKLNGYCRVTYEISSDYPLTDIPSGGIRDLYIVKRSVIDHQSDIGRQILKEPYWVHFQFSNLGPAVKVIKKGSTFTYNYCESKLESGDLGLEYIGAHNNLINDKNPMSPESIHSLIQRIGFSAVKYKN